jgi:hypothetical protein
MKLKHNKKRNTAFIFESLVKEITKAVLQKNEKLKNDLFSILKEHFNSSSLMLKEIKLYKSLCETHDLDPPLAERLIYEVRAEHKKINKEKLFNEQSKIINKINKLCSREFFSNFVPNYRNLATVYQIFSEETPIKKRILLENNLVKTLSSENGEQENIIKPIDNLIYKSFVERFNSQYSQKLISEQRELLSKFICSFSDNGIELKLFLNEEVSRLKKSVKHALTLKEVKADSEMVKKVESVINIIENFKDNKINKNMIMRVLKIQNLVKEISENADNS